MGEGVQKWNSRKLAAAIATVGTAFNLDIPPTELAYVIGAVGVVYVGVQGLVDSVEKLARYYEAKSDGTRSRRYP